MGLINETLGFINNAAFGYLDRAKDEIINAALGYDSFLRRPIGLLTKDYGFMTEHLRRNIGNTAYSYDGYGISIGEVANPFYNTIIKTPWFYLDNDKNSASNYIDYIKNVYGASTSVQNINELHDLRIIGEASKVKSIPITTLIDTTGLRDTEYILSLSPNNTYTDTMLGKDGILYGTETLRNSIAENSSRNSIGITASLSDYYGLKYKSVENGVLNAEYAGEKNGKSFNRQDYIHIYIPSPVYNSNFGNYSSLGVYYNYYDSLGDDNKQYLSFNMNQNRPNKDKGIFRYSPSFINGVSSSGSNYLDSVLNAVEVSNIRYILKTPDDMFSYDGSVGIYDEDTGKSSYENTNSGTRFNAYVKFGDSLKSSSLLYKTNKAFKNGQYETLIGKFKTNYATGQESDITQSAISKSHGMSRGRNLLKKDAIGNYSSEYDNPYCRVWTYHHQYNKLKDTIRPFINVAENGNASIVSQEELYSKYGFDAFSADNSKKGFDNGRERLGKYGVINKNNGLINISPANYYESDKKVDIKNCMFSIENLAWKDTFAVDYKSKADYNIMGLSPEQKGPFGGRIMWFPPYDLQFSEDVSVSWASTSFIGRGEDIYTYKNTTRAGSLSFKLLIDHPSIVNYWENRSVNGDGTNSVDAVDSSEQELLRFFAGCDFLTPKKVETKNVNSATVDEPVPSPDSECYVFYVFFPNNYSGRHDRPSYAMNYLTNGFGTWIYKCWKLATGKNIETFYTYMDAKNRCDELNIDYSKINEIEDDLEPTYASLTVYNDDDESGIKTGGYEMRAGKGINYPKEKYDDESVEIGKVVYGKSETKIPIFVQTGATEYMWYYRVDRKLTDESISKENHLDVGSQCLNSKNGLSIVKEHSDVKETDKVVSFSDVFVALMGDSAKQVLEGLYDNENVEKIKSLKNSERIEKITCIGYDSGQGGTRESERLKRNRANTVKDWLCDYNFCTADKVFAKFDEEGFEENVQDINDINAKLHRCVKVEIYVKTEESNTVQNLETEAVRNADNEVGEGQTKTLTNVPYPTNNNIGNKTFLTDYSANINYDPTIFGLGNKVVKLNFLDNINNNLGFNTRNLAQIGVTQKPVLNDLKLPNTDAMFAQASYNSYALHNLETTDMTADEKAAQGGFITGNVEDEELLGRYDNETKFFKLLEINEPFLHHRISDKVKYFDPAFHSISPEGFNARLTFLQQCCRQGPTVGSSDTNTAENTANNLAFGRPPVCVLRLGDFYYTKIIIESLSINYDRQWDLNIEGIGAMPMIADVQLRFKFIGGSSLAGPISRLQNALSFNMYANTEVYDNRAELAEYNDDGDIVRLAPFNPSK